MGMLIRQHLPPARESGRPSSTPGPRGEQRRTQIIHCGVGERTCASTGEISPIGGSVRSGLQRAEF